MCSAGNDEKQGPNAPDSRFSAQNKVNAYASMPSPWPWVCHFGMVRGVRGTRRTTGAVAVELDSEGGRRTELAGALAIAFSAACTTGFPTQKPRRCKKPNIP